MVRQPRAARSSERPELVERHSARWSRTTRSSPPRTRRPGRDGVLLYVPAGVEVAVPLRASLQLADAGAAQHWRALIVLERGARATFSRGVLVRPLPGYLNGVVELVVGDERAARVRDHAAAPSRDAPLRHPPRRGRARRRARLGRHRPRRQAGQVADGVLPGRPRGARQGDRRVRPRGTEHVDYDTTQEHAAPNTTSDLYFKGVLADRARSVWRGVIRVDKGAQSTDAYQENRNLLLSPQAHADSIPGLEIQANDVRCTHGATVGQVDKLQLFYLMSRGLSPARGRAADRARLLPADARPDRLGRGARVAGRGDRPTAALRG